MGMKLGLRLRRRHAVLVGLLILVSSPSTSASTMGFTRQFDFPPGTPPTLHWIALPWSYQPQDVGTPSPLV